MQNISLKSLVPVKLTEEIEIDRILQEDFDREVNAYSQHRALYSNSIQRGILTEAEVDEGFLDTGMAWIKRKMTAAAEEYKQAKADGDKAAEDRAKKKYEDAAEQAKKSAAAAGRTGEEKKPGESAPAIKPEESPTTSTSDRSEDEKLADLYTSRKTPTKVTQSPDTASSSEDAPDATPGGVSVGKAETSPMDNKPGIDANVAHKLCKEIVAKLLKTDPKNRYTKILQQAVTNGDSKTIMAYFNKVQGGATSKIKSEIFKQYKQEKKASKNYTGVIRKYIQSKKMDVASALALIDIVRGLAKLDIKERFAMVSRAFGKKVVATKPKPVTPPPAKPTTPATVAPTPTAPVAPMVSPTPPAPIAPAPAFVNTGGNAFAPATMTTAQRTADMNAALARDADAQAAGQLPSAVAQAPTSVQPPVLQSPAAASNVPTAAPVQPTGALAQWNNWTKQFQPQQRAEMKTREATKENYALYQKAYAEWLASGKQGPEPERLFGKPPRGTSVRYENKKLTENRNAPKVFKRSNTNPNVFIIS